jgi:hypothetical protein
VQQHSDPRYPPYAVSHVTIVATSPCSLFPLPANLAPHPPTHIQNPSKSEVIHDYHSSSSILLQPPKNTPPATKILTYLLLHKVMLQKDPSTNTIPEVEEEEEEEERNKKLRMFSRILHRKKR